jgi:cation-transporting ATPase F
MDAAASVDRRNGHHGLATHEVVLLLETDADHGLADAEARRRLERYGPNVLPEARTSGSLVRFARQFNHPLIYVLLVAGVVTLVLGENTESAVIFGVVLTNAVVGFIQESKAEDALDALRAMVHTDARVRRSGRERQIPSDELVPGDVVLIEAGDKVPADLRLLQVTELQVDESALTGESVPVAKDEVVLADATPVSDRRNMVYSATLVTNGTGVGVTVATGSETELGEIHRLVGTADRLATPLTRKLSSFSKVLTVAILGLAAFTFAVGVLRGESAAEMFTAAVALAVGAIPEGLPAAVTITLAIGVNRMARRRAVIRRLPAVETLGSTTVVCSDKTGTLTENQMTVRALWTPDARFEVSGSGYTPDGEVRDSTGSAVAANSESLRWTLVAGAACNDARLTQTDGTWGIVGDPTEGAMLVTAAKGGLDVDGLATSMPRVAAIPFSSDRQYMATLHQSGHDGTLIVLVKGAVERVTELCATEMAGDGSPRPINHSAIMTAADDLAGECLRVLATATGHIADPTGFEPGSFTGELVFTGLQAMLDPPRAAAAAAVRSCHTAGIDVKMITGDHAATATAIAEQLGLLDERRPGDVLTGPELAALSVDEYPDAVERASVFARVSPEQKLRLVEGLQALRHVVAMTGDGVNDAPALQQADIGIAMGRGGTEVAKEAADMILTDDDFATIEAAVEEGRGVFDNLTKFIVWTLPTNMGEGFVVLVAIVLGLALPILPVQILWINMTTAVALGLMLAFEPKEDGIMLRPPRDPRIPLLTGTLIARIVLVSTLLVGGAWWLFEWEQNNGATLAEARTAALNLFVAVEAFYLFNCRSLTRSVWKVGLFTNRWILAGITVQAIGQIAITYLPAMNTVFQTAPIGSGAWIRVLLFAAVAAAVVATEKALRRRRGQAALAPGTR